MVALTRTGRVSHTQTEEAIVSTKFALWELKRLIPDGPLVIKRGKRGFILGHYLWLLILLLGMVLTVAYCGGATDATDRSPEARMVEKWPWE